MSPLLWRQLLPSVHFEMCRRIQPSRKALGPLRAHNPRLAGTDFAAPLSQRALAQFIATQDDEILMCASAEGPRGVTFHFVKVKHQANGSKVPTVLIYCFAYFRAVEADDVVAVAVDLI